MIRSDQVDSTAESGTGFANFRHADQPIMIKQRVTACLVPGMVAMALFVAAYVAFWIHDTWRSPYPLEFREDAIVAFSQLYANEGNPYLLKDRPVQVNVYGIGYHWVVRPFAHVFGATYQVHRAVSILFVTASCVLLGWILRRDKVSLAFAVTGALILFIQLGQGLSIVSRPDGLGLFLFLAALLIPYRFAFSTRSLVVSIGLSILAFLTKPYFLLSLALVPGYVFLSVGKLRGLVAGVAAIGALMVTVLAVHSMYECCFTETFFVNLGGASRSWKHLRSIAAGYLVLNWALLAMLLGGLISGAWNRLPRSSDPMAPQTTSGLLSLIDPYQPLLRGGISYPWFLLISGTLVIVFILGLHQGNGILYYHQFVTPFLLWIVFVQADVKWKRPWWAVMLMIVSLGWLNARTPRLPGDYTREWTALEQLTASHTNIFNSPHLTHFLLKQGKPIYDTGLTEYSPLATKRNVLGIASAYEQKWKAYRETLAENIRQQTFDLVAIPPGVSRVLPLGELRKHYVLKDTLAAPMAFDSYPVDTFPIDIWVPRPRESGAAP